MSKQQEYIKSLINENTYIKNGKEYKRYYANFEGEKISYSSYEKTYNTLENLINGVDLRVKSTKEKQIEEETNKTIGEIIPLWFNEYKLKRKHSTAHTIHQVIIYQILPNFGNTKIKDITYEQIQLAVNSCTTKNMAKKMFVYLRLFYKDRKYIKLFDDNPFEKVEIKNYTPIKEKPIYEKHEIETILLNHKKAKYGFCYYLLAKTGMRIGEIMALDLGDFKNNGENYYIEINKTKTKGAIYENFNQATLITEILTTKTKSSTRKIPITLETYKELSEYIGCGRDIIQCEMYINENKEKPLLLTDKGSRVNHCVLTKDFHKLLEMCGIDRHKRTLHTLRHSFITQMITNGADISTVSKYVGHANTSITLNVYTHSTPEELRDFLEDNEKDEISYKRIK